MAVNATKWLAVCLHYNEPWETFLAKSVRPYIEVVLQTGVAERFFFERKWEQGPHIRLWFKSTEFLLEKMLLPNLREYFQTYFDSKPSFLIEPTHLASLPSEHRWHPNNTVQVLDNQIFGSETPLGFMERQYLASSRITLELIKNNEGKWWPNERLSNALKLHLGMFYAGGMTLNEAQSFSVWAYKNWELGQQTQASEPDNSLQLRTSFQTAFDLLRPDVVSYLSATWELFKNYRKVESLPFIHWIHVNSKAYLELDLALATGRLNPLVTPHPAPSAVWTFYADFMDKTNNRLGIVHKNEEGYLYFVLAQTLKLMSQNAFSLTHAEYAKINAA